MLDLGSTSAIIAEIIIYLITEFKEHKEISTTLYMDPTEKNLLRSIDVLKKLANQSIH